MHGGPSIDVHPLIDEYMASISGKAEGTINAYRRALRDVIAWIVARPTSGGNFTPDLLTRTALETYLSHLEISGASISQRARVKSAVSGFAQWLIEDKGILRRNPARRVTIPSQALLAPRQLNADQRFVLRTLVERDCSMRSEALFALGYWAGCRVSDIAWLRLDDTHIGPKIGWVHIGYKGNKTRDIDLINEARRPLYAYLHHGGRDPDSPYVFTSQRNHRFTEAGIHHWFRILKAGATKAEWELIYDVSFHDLRHDFAHRAREAGWSLEEVAYYLGHVTKKGTPAIQTTARYTQVNREQVKEKLKLIRG